VGAKSRRMKVADRAVAASLPSAVSAALLSLQVKIPVRKLRGKALPSGTGRPAAIVRVNDHSRSSRGHQTPSQSDIGYDDVDSSSRDVGVKSKFIGLSEKSMCIGVEELALEWFKAHSRWNGAHDEGGAVRFVWCLLFWECAIYAPVADVFQTPFQTAPWDLSTEAFYPSRKEAIDARLAEIRAMAPATLASTVRESYTDESHTGVLCVGGSWDAFSADDVACIAEGLGPTAVAHACELLCRDYAYWSGGLPDLVLWKRAGADGRAEAKLVEVKSQRDTLSSRQRAWLAELTDGAGADCEVFKVVERETKQNAGDLRESDLDAEQLAYLELEDIGGGDGVEDGSDCGDCASDEDEHG
jgi:hypothetical protein